jgi:hypothetical protein
LVGTGCAEPFRKSETEVTVLQNLSNFMLSSNLFSAGNLWILLGIVVAACVLGVEVACIAILVKKMQTARRARMLREEEEDRSGYGQFAAIAFSMVMLPFSAATVLIALAGLVALAAMELSTISAMAVLKS